MRPGRAVLSLLCSLLAATSFASGNSLSLNVQGAWYPSSHEGLDSSGFAPLVWSASGGGDGERTVGSSIGDFECKGSLSLSRKMAFLAGSGPLTSGNNLELKGSFELSPVSTNLVAEASLTPVAFLVLGAGASAGTGWNVLGFQGLGINTEGPSGEIDEDSFGGAVTRLWASLTLQADLAALYPGEWHHLVFLANGKLEYRALSSASAGEAWMWEANRGEAFNGARFIGTWLLGYQMPRTLKLVGLMAESTEWLGKVRSYSTMDDGGWGSDFRSWRIGVLGSVGLSEKDELVVILQFKDVPDWTDGTTLNRDFRERVWESDIWTFNRVAVSFTHRFW